MHGYAMMCTMILGCTEDMLVIKSLISPFQFVIFSGVGIIFDISDQQ